MAALLARAIGPAEPPPFPLGSWVRWSSRRRPQYGQITAWAGPTAPPVLSLCTILILDRMWRLRDTRQVVVRAADSGLTLGVAWRGFLSLADQRAVDDATFGNARADAAAPRFVWRWQGDVAAGALDLSAAYLVGRYAHSFMRHRGWRR